MIAVVLLLVVLFPLPALLIALAVLGTVYTPHLVVGFTVLVLCAGFILFFVMPVYTFILQPIYRLFRGKHRR